MAALTKLALTQANTALANDNTALRAQVGELTVNLDIAAKALALAEAQIAGLRAELVTVTEVASAINKMPKQRPAYVMPQWQKDRQEAMAAAKALAVSGHRCVVV